MLDTHYVERLPYHPLLGRNVNHDPQSRSYRLGSFVASQAADLGEVYHPTFCDVMDQGRVGSCTGDTGIEAIYAAPVAANSGTAWAAYPRNQDGAYWLYASATANDDYAGTFTYPPPGGQDTGSDGLTIAKRLVAAGIISGYLWAFTPQEAVGALATSGVMTGIPWFNSMFDTDTSGLVTVRQDSGLAGGHEIYVWGHIPAVGNSPARVKFRNHWSASWGDHGDGLMLVSDWVTLLGMNGDVTKLVPAAVPAPVPNPPVDDRTAGDRLWSAIPHGWATKHHTGDNARAARAVQRFGVDTGRV